MDISSGIANTGAAIQRGMARFDASAQKVVDDAASMSDEISALGGGFDELISPKMPILSNGESLSGSQKLPGDMVQMQSDATMNQMLFNVFKRQQDQQETLMSIVNPKI